MFILLFVHLYVCDMQTNLLYENYFRLENGTIFFVCLFFSLGTINSFTQTWLAHLSFAVVRFLFLSLSFSVSFLSDILFKPYSVRSAAVGQSQIECVCIGW